MKNTFLKTLAVVLALFAGFGIVQAAINIVPNGGTGVGTITGIIKGNGTSPFTAAVSGTDYAPATSGTSILKGNGSGGFSNASAGTDYEVPLTFGDGLTRTANDVDVDTTQNILKLSNLTSNGFVKTSGGDGTLSIDTNTYLTGNQTITLSGDVSGSGATSITTTIGNDKILESMLKAVDAAADEECLSYESTGGDFEWQTCGGGSGDITSVGDVASGAAFDGTQGTTLTFDDADGDQTFLYNTTTNGFELSDDLSVGIINLTGTGTLNGLDSIDATGEATLEGVLDLQDLQGAVTDSQVPNNITIDLATLASTVTVVDSTDATSFPLIADSATGSLAVKTDGGLTYDASNGTLSSTILTEGANGVPNATDHLGFFAATTSAQLAGVLSDETGSSSGLAVFSNSPVFTDDFDLAAAGIRMTGADGVLTLLGLGNGNDENLTFDFDNGTANQVDIASGTSVSQINWTGILSFPTLTLSGTGTINGLDAIDSTSETTLEAAIDIAGDVTGTGLGSVVIADNAVDGTDISLSSEVSGDIMYFNGTDWVRLAKGTAGQVLEMNSGATAPEWDTDDGAVTVTTEFPRPGYITTGVTQNGPAYSSNTTAHFTAFVLDHTITINKFSFADISTVTVAGDIKVGIYSEDGQTRHLNETINIAATGEKTHTLGASLTLTPGRYYFAIVPSGTTQISNVRSWGIGTIMAENLNTISSEPIITGTATVTASTLPTTFNPVSDLTGAHTSFLPGIRFDN